MDPETTPAVPNVAPIIGDAAEKSWDAITGVFTDVLPYAIGIGVLAFGVRFVSSKLGTRGHL